MLPGQPMLFLDTNIFLYAVGREHPLREACRQLIQRISEGELLATTSTEVVQEVLHVLCRRGECETGCELAAMILELFPDLLVVGRTELEEARRLLLILPDLPVRDAIHAATLRTNSIQRLVTADRHFDRVGGLERISPADALL
jgi:uncharacterized protein